MATLKEIDELILCLESKDDKERYKAFQTLLELTESKVKWIYDKWYLLIEKLSSDNSYQRSIGLLLIANLAKSDDENRIIKILDKYLEHLEDEKFITSRQCIQNIWKIALCNKTLEERIIKSLEDNYYNNAHLKTHGNLIKQDIISSLGKIYYHIKRDSLLNKIKSLIDEENDIKLKKALIKSSGMKL
jgi:hypothetical protein